MELGSLGDFLQTDTDLLSSHPEEAINTHKN